LKVSPCADILLKRDYFVKEKRMAYIEGVARNQGILFPEVLEDYITEDNSVRFIDAFVDSLDLVGLGFKYAEPEPTGRPPYNPGDLLKLYVYGYLNRLRSSRGLERETYRNVELMWLIRKLKPDFKTIADFRKDNKVAIRGICGEFIFLCKHLDLFGGELIAIDGSKFRAVNSKKRNFNEEKLKRKIREIEEKVEGYLEELDENDKEERGVDCPDREGLKKKIEEIKRRKEEYRGLLEGLRESGEKQISITDPEAKAMLNNQRIEVCYNVQLAVDSKHKLILAHEVTNEVSDQNQLSGMAKRVKEVVNRERIKVLADKGYYNPVQIKECVDKGIIPYIPELESGVTKGRGIPGAEFSRDKFRYDKERDVYLCPEGKELRFMHTATHHGKRMRFYKSKGCMSCKVRGLCTRDKEGRIMTRWEHEGILEEMRERVKQEKEKVKLRNLLTEHVFGTMKRGFNQGYMLLKGKEKAGAEISLTVLSYNIKRALNIVGLKRLVEAVGGVCLRQIKNPRFKEAKQIFSYILKFLQKRVNCLLPFTEINLLYPSFHTI
jgi:transposase